MNKVCQQCGGNASLFIKSYDFYKKISKKQFLYYKCDNCKYIRLDPIPTDLAKYYPDQYYELPETYEELNKMAELSQQWKIDTVLQFKSNGRLLEIGPAFGMFAFLAKRSGFEVTGIEMDHKCCEFLRGTIGISVVEDADTVSALATQQPFDVIVLWQVFEHLPDPWSALAAIAERLKPGGVLILDMPNPDAFQFKVLGRRWVHLDPPRHVSLIPSELLIQRAAKHNLKPELVTTSNHGANGYNGFGWAVSFKNMLGENIMGSVAHFLGRALGKLMIPVERTGRRGSTYTVVLKKGVST